MSERTDPYLDKLMGKSTGESIKIDNAETQHRKGESIKIDNAETQHRKFVQAEMKKQTEYLKRINSGVQLFVGILLISIVLSLLGNCGGY
jgi:hypothetical protein